MSAVGTLAVREARPDEHAAAGRLLVAVYAALPGFSSPQEQPDYYATLANVGTLAGRPGAQLLVAAGADGALAGVVVYFGDMAQYGGGGIASELRDAAGIRLLAVDPARRGGGVGRLLTQTCIARARAARRWCCTPRGPCRWRGGCTSSSASCATSRSISTSRACRCTASACRWGRPG